MNNRSPYIFLAGVSCLLAGLVVLDWYFRFSRYRFEMQLFHLPARAMAGLQQAETTFTTNVITGRQGGDLSSLIGIRAAAIKYEEARQPGVIIRDPQGFANAPYEHEGEADVVVVGDSFMASGLLADTFSAQLSQRLNRFVLNRALIGHGPFLSLENYLRSAIKQDAWPDALIWGFAEREVVGRFFERIRLEIDALEREDAGISDRASVSGPGFKIHWASFHPRYLQKALPGSSLFAQTSQWVWTRARYGLFDQLHPDLLRVDDLAGGPMLFYRYHRESLSVPVAEREPDKVLGGIRALDRFCKQRNIHLVVVLIPEKEQIYRDGLPSIASPEMPESILGVVEKDLIRYGVDVVNLLPVFVAATERGERLYWRDDTHWNPSGIALAADAVAVRLNHSPHL